MEFYEECAVCRLDGSVCYRGDAWVSSGGLLEASWVENGEKKHNSFYANGQPVGFWNKYILKHLT